MLRAAAYPVGEQVVEARRGISRSAARSDEEGETPRRAPVRRAGALTTASACPQHRSSNPTVPAGVEPVVSRSQRRHERRRGRTNGSTRAPQRPNHGGQCAPGEKRSRFLTTLRCSAHRTDDGTCFTDKRGDVPVVREVLPHADHGLGDDGFSEAFLMSGGGAPLHPRDEVDSAPWSGEVGRGRLGPSRRVGGVTGPRASGNPCPLASKMTRRVPQR